MAGGGLRVGGWGLMVASGVASAYVGIWLREQRVKEEKKEFGIGLVTRGKGFEPQRR